MSSTPRTPPNTWRDWTPKSSGISWTNTEHSRGLRKFDAGRAARDRHHHGEQRAGRREGLGDGPPRLRAQGHDAPRTATSATRRSLYTPFQSTADDGGGASYSSTSLLGRGKKVTVVYGTLTNPAGDADGQRLGPADARARTRRRRRPALDGIYVFYDGQGCTVADGLDGGCTGARRRDLDVRQRQCVVEARDPRRRSVRGSGGDLSDREDERSGEERQSTFATFAAPVLPTYTFTSRRTARPTATGGSAVGAEQPGRRWGGCHSPHRRRIASASLAARVGRSPVRAVTAGRRRSLSAQPRRR